MANQTILINHRLCKILQTYNAVRFMRRYLPPTGKPPITPPHEKKLTRALEPEWLSPEDAKELLWRRQVYKNVLKSMRRVYKEEYETYMTEKTYGWPKIYAEERAELNHLIEEQNERLRQGEIMRAQRDKENYEQMKNEFLEGLEEKLEKDHKELEERTQEILRQIERTEHFLTPENMEREIEYALEHPVNYNYCIDLRGTKFYDPEPLKYPDSAKRQTGRRFDRTLAPSVLSKEELKKLRTEKIETKFKTKGRFARYIKAPVEGKVVDEAIDMAVGWDDVEKFVEGGDTNDNEKKMNDTGKKESKKKKKNASTKES